MILVLVSALGMAAALWVSRLGWKEIQRLRAGFEEGAFLLTPLLVLVLLKMGWSWPREGDERP